MAYHSKEAIAVIIATLVVALVAGCTALTIINIEFDTNNADVEIKNKTPCEAGQKTSVSMKKGLLPTSKD